MHLVGCTNSGATLPDDRATMEWQRHMKVLERFVEGGNPLVSEISNAARFFREVSGIDVRMTGSPMGLLATKETLEDLDALKAWYQSKSSRLTWNSREERVQVREKAQ